MSATYQFPSRPPIRFQVTVADNGAIRVRQGHLLSRYSMAIHGVPYVIYEYGRLNANRLELITDVNRIFAGETIYHIPTWNRNSDQTHSPMAIVADAPQPTPEPQRRREIERFIRDNTPADRSMAAAIASGLSKLVSTARTATVLAELAGAGISATVMTVTGLLSTFSTLVGSILAIIYANESTVRNAARIGYCYGLASWAFEESKPPLSQRYQRNLQNSIGSHRRGAVRAAWDQAVNDCHDNMISALATLNGENGTALSSTTFRILLAATADNDPAKLSLLAAENIAPEITTRGQERAAFLSAVRGGCQYNA